MLPFRSLSYSSFFWTTPDLRGVLYGGEPALLVGLALVRKLNFPLPLHGNFMALLAGLDLARVRYQRASQSECVYMENPSPPRRDLG